MTALIVGGTSGLGLEIADLLKSRYDNVVITGRKDPKVKGLTFAALPLGSGQGFPIPMDHLVTDHAPFDTVVYNPGFYQEGRISDLTDKQILDMVNVGFLGAAMLMQRILKSQGTLRRFVAITSTSQWTPRELEPVYTGVKAALGMFANSLSLDKRIERTLVAAPAGMKTPFWEGLSKDTSAMLEPKWVADQICIHLYFKGSYSYCYLRILRDPPRTEIVETR
ncbi:MAG TPA: SDR family oxidoreductase [Candidatus Paceibacterota bacterium]|nr:SDR family oxidoreductase [Candidatus Paceibacterota bacterium]